MTISSTEEISKQLVGILSARTKEELLKAMGNDKEYWLSVFLVISVHDFTHLQEYRSFTHTSTYSYISLPMALSLIPNFDINSNAYGTQEKQKRKFKQLLSALSFLDCDIFNTLLMKRFKWDLIEEVMRDAQAE